MKLDLPIVDDTSIWDSWMAMLNVPAISAAIELGIFESLNQEPVSAEVLAKKLDYKERAVCALLPFLGHLGFLNEYGGTWKLTPLARHYMLNDSQFSWGGIFRREGRMMKRHGLLIEAITGKKQDQDGRDRPAESWESGQVDMDMAREVTAFMHSHSIAAAVGMTKTIDFSGVTRMLDVGGGSGCFAIALAKMDKNNRCTVLELPAICELANDYIAEAGVAEQVDTTSIDMFREPWPEGYNAHFFSNIFHDWSFETCRELTRSSFDALEPGGKILLHEMLLNDSGNGPYPANAFSLLMAIGTMGQQFTLPQLREILGSAGFVNIDSRNSYGYYSIVSGEKPA